MNALGIGEANLHAVKSRRIDRMKRESQ